MAENEEKKEETGEVPKGELEDTRGEIEVKESLKKEATKTDIRIEADEEKTPVEALEKAPSFLDRLGLKKWFQKLGGLQKKPLFGWAKLEKPIGLKLRQYAAVWMAPPHLPLPQKLLYYLSRIFILVVGVALLVLLFQSLIDVYQRGAGVPWILLCAALGSLILSLLSLILRWPPPLFIGFPLAAHLALLLYQSFFFPTSDPTFFVLMGVPPAYVYNHIWMALLLFELLLIIFIYPRFLPVKLFLVFLALYGLSGFAINRIEGIPLEASWEGIGIFRYIPFIFVQPVFATLHYFVPLFFFVSVISLFFKGNREKVAWIGLNILILGLTGALGLTHLHQNRVPSVLSFILEAPLGIGSAEIKSDRVLLGLKTVNFDTFKGNDTIERYRFHLTPGKKSKGKGASQDFFLSAYHISGFPVLFLAGDDLELTVNGQAYSRWSIKPFRAKADDKNLWQGSPQYTLSLVIPTPAPIFDISLPVGRPVLTPEDAVSFSLTRESPPVSSFEVIIDGKSALIKKVAESQRSFSFPLSRLADGKHRVEVKMVSVGGTEASQSQEITIQSIPHLVIDFPMEGDYFSNSVSVFARTPTPRGKNLDSVRFLIDDQELARKTLPPYQVTLDTAFLTPGKHALKVVARWKNGEEQSQTVALVKGSYVGLSFLRPTLGEFLSSETEVKVKIDGDNPYHVLDLLLNDQKIHQWTTVGAEAKKASYTYQWDTSGLEPGDYLLRVRGKTSEGVQSSDWVQVFTGEGKLQILPPAGMTRNKALLQYKSVVLVLDVSISQWDSLDGKPKWVWVKSLFTMPRVQEKLKGIEVGMVLFGSEKPYYRHDCSDVSRFEGKGKFNHQKVLAWLKKKNPKGVSALLAAVKEGLKTKPQKMIVITDGADTCHRKLTSSFVKVLSRSKETVIDVLALGSLSKSDEALLKTLAQKGSGKLISVRHQADFQEKIVEMLTFYYTVFLNEKIVLEAPIDGKSHDLRPGSYLLKMELDPPFKERKISIKNGLITELNLVFQKDQTEMEESFRVIH